MYRLDNKDGSKKMLTIDDFLNGIKYVGPTYSGPASDGGILIKHISGKSIQETTNGYQLFNANNMPNSSDVGVTVVNNKDGSFDLIGTATNQFQSDAIIHSKKMFKAGSIYLSYSDTAWYLVFEVKRNSSNYRLAILRSNESNIESLDITQEWLDDPDVIFCSFFFAHGGTAINVKNYKPMLYQDGDGTWEPFTGGLPAPNPDYPMGIKNFTSGKFISKAIGTIDGFLTEDSTKGWCSSATLDGKVLTLTPITSEANNGFFANSVKNVGDSYDSTAGKLFEIPAGSKEISILSKSGIFNACFFSLYNSAKVCVSASIIDSDGKASLVIPQGAVYFSIRVGCKEKSPVGTYQDEVSVLVTIDQIDEPIILRSLPDGTKDEYLGNGKILRRVGYVEFEGASDEAWTSTAAAGYGKFNIEIPNAPVIDGEFGNRLMVNRFKFDNSQGWTTPRGNSLILGLSAYEGRIGFTLHGVETLADWKTWLSTHPIKLVYLLKNSIIETITPLLLESQNPKAYCYTNSEVDTDIEWQILPEGSLLPAVKALRQRVEELESEAIS